jgi:hypothetical protein
LRNLCVSAPLRAALLFSRFCWRLFYLFGTDSIRFISKKAMIKSNPKMFRANSIGMMVFTLLSDLLNLRAQSSAREALGVCRTAAEKSKERFALT